MDRIDALRLLSDVADAGSFSAVGRQRAIATSTVALAISQLEEEFGTRLLVRSTRRLVFTHEGESLLADGRRIVAEWDAMMQGLTEDGPLAGPIRITATNDFGRTQLRPVLDSFQRRYPDVHISLVLNDRTLDLIDERIDLALRTGPLPDSSLRARLLVRGKRLVCAAPSYWARAGKPAHPNDLIRHNCLILARPGAPLAAWPFLDGDKQFSIKASGDREASDGGVLREWALAGVGVVLKNRWDISREIAAGLLETVLDDYAAGQIDLYAVQPNGPPSRRVATLVAFLAESFGAAPPAS